MEEMLRDPAAWSQGLELETPDDAQVYKRAVIGALFAISYRFEARYSTFVALLDQLIAVEEGMLLWRGRHLHMAERMIGRRGGTGGTSSGVGYLDITRKYRIFHALWLARKMAMRSSALPPFESWEISEKSMFL
jgi:tryptophan 2,3-dioxygenase